jgi:glycosyltransferase involved in cell wall biosynthesis
MFKRLLRSWLTTCSDGSIASTSDGKDTFIHYGAKAQRVLTSIMPIDVDQFYEKTREFRKTMECRLLRGEYTARTECSRGSANGPILLSVGRITRQKGYAELFKIYRHILTVRPDVSLLIVGDGPDRPMYEQQVREEGWTHVHFIGFVQPDELHKFLAIADIFVFHTLFDPFGAVLSEAMAAELPVVSSIHASATRDLVEEGVTGFRIDPRDIDSSAATILKVLEMKPEERAAMSRAAYARVKQYDIGASADAIVRFIEPLPDSEGSTGKGRLHENG